MANNSPQQIQQLPFANYAAQRPRYTPDLESSILNMFGQFGVDVSRYGGGVYADPQSRLERIANELRSGQRSFTDVENSLRLAASELSPEQLRANQVAAYEFNPQYQQMNRALQQIDWGREQGTDYAQRLGQYGQQALGNVYDLLGQQFAGNRASTDEAFQGAIGRVGSTFDEGNALLQAQQQAADAQMQGQAASLGVAGATVDPQADLQNTVSQMLQFNESGRQNATSTLESLRSATQGINTQAMNDAASQGALAQSQHQLSVNDMLSGILQQFGNQQFDVLGQMSDLESSRGARTAELLRGFQDQTYERGRQSELDRLAAEISRGTLALQNQELGLNRQQFGHQQGLDWAQFGLESELGRGELAIRQQQIAAELAQTMDPARRRQLELENQILEMRLREGAGGGAMGTGEQGVQRFIQGLPPQMGPTGPNQTYQGAFNALRQAAIRAAQSDPRYGGDPFAAYEFLLSTGSNPAPQLDSILRQLGEIYWGANA